MSISNERSDDPVARTKRQLECYYRCVSRDQELCPQCRKWLHALDRLLSNIREESDGFWRPRY